MAAPSDDLLKVQQEKLAQFQEITQIEDLDSCKNLLITHSWDLERAVEEAFRLPSPDRAPPTEQTPLVNQNFEAADYTLTQWRYRGWLSYSFHILQWPMSFFFRTFYNVARFVCSIFWHPPITAADATEETRKFIRAFRETYTLTPNFIESSYSQVLTKTRTELRFLLVYLHNPSHEDTADFCSRVFCTPTVIDWLNDNMLVWGCSSHSRAGYTISRDLGESTYPFLAVLVLRESRLTVVARIRGRVESADQLVSILTTVKSDNEASLRAAQLEREELNFNQTLRQQQDEAYMESLRADQEKERKKREAVELLRQQEAEEQRKTIEAQEAIERLEQEKLNLAGEIPEEPPVGYDGSIQIALRLPSGQRLNRRFLLDESMKYLHYYVLCHKDAPDNFEIHTTYPRRKIPCDPSGDNEPPTFGEFGLAKNESLMVSDLDA